jgi:NAD(P)-dependent dehydrogenase (short-subunit alcohol dehydrogenase family)
LVALVLGGGTAGQPGDDVLPMGNGRAISLRLAAEGAMVVVADASLASAQVTVDEIERSGGAAAAVHFEATDPRSCAAAVGSAVSFQQRLDVVVCNVGVHGNQRFRQQTVDDWDRSFDFNARSHFLVAQAALEPMLMNGGGSIVFVASTAALRSSGTSVAYEASKAAQLALMRHLAVRYGHRGIRSNALVLGVIDSAMVRELFDDGVDAHAMRAGMSPMGREGRPEEVGVVAAFLASSDSSYINGAALPIDGGLGALSPALRTRQETPRG